MSENTLKKTDIAGESGDNSMSPAQPSPAAVEAIKSAPQAVKRSMPMALSIGLGILLAGLIGWLFHNLMWFVLVLYLCFVAATILEAPVYWIRRRNVPRTLAAALVMLVLLGVVCGTLYVLTNGIYGQVTAVSANLEKTPERVNMFVNGMKRHFPALAERMRDFDLASEIAKASPDFSALLSNARWGVELISGLVIMFFVVLYMLIDGPRYLKGMRAVLPRSARLEATNLFHAITRAHRSWILASLFNVTTASILTGVGLFLLGVPGAILMGFIAGLGELVPNIGPFLGSLPAIVLTLIALPDHFFYVVGMFIIVQTIQGYTITPLVVRLSIELPVLVTIISVLVFGMLFGFLGVLVAIPLVADMVVVWGYLNRYMEKDTTDYDEVNEPATGVRSRVGHDGGGSRLRRMLGGGRRNPESSDIGRAGRNSVVPATGLDGLAEAERRAGRV